MLSRTTARTCNIHTHVHCDLHTCTCTSTHFLNFYSLGEPFLQLFLGAARGIDNVTVGDDTKAAVARGDTLVDWEDTQGTTSSQVKLQRGERERERDRERERNRGRDQSHSHQ